MTEADTELIVSSLTAIVVAITGSVTAYYGYRNHALGQVNSNKLDVVQQATGGAAHTLASKNDDLIRSFVAGATGAPVSLPPSPPP